MKTGEMKFIPSYLSQYIIAFSKRKNRLSNRFLISNIAQLNFRFFRLLVLELFPRRENSEKIEAI